MLRGLATLVFLCPTPIPDCICLNIAFLQRDTAGQERFRTITTAYYRGAMVRVLHLFAVLVVPTHPISLNSGLFISYFFSIIHLFASFLCTLIRFQLLLLLLLLVLLFLLSLLPLHTLIFPNSLLNYVLINFATMALFQGIILVYDVTNEKSFDNIKTWIR